jgi:ribosomal protein S18 acetylase RimI-like enzyme
MIDLARAAHEAATVRKATPHELDSLAAVLARAFYEDPVFSWVVSDDGRRLRLLQRSFRLYLRRLWFAQNECYTTENVAGAVVWELPGEWKAGVLDRLRLLPSMLAINGRLLPRILRALAAAESDHPADPHYYLPVVGVEPEWQGRGLGTALMRPVLERCDDDMLPAYLEATSPRNRALYQRHGFEVTGQFSVGPGSPPSWRMWRTPHG